MNDVALTQKKIPIYYDGTCGLCNGIIGKLEQSSQGENFEPIPIVEKSPPGVTAAEAWHDVHAIDSNGKMYRGGDAVLFILFQYPRWRWLAAIGKLPGIRQLVSLGYRIVADNRHRFDS
jgi:predicted DCC family thiol-disulfide oxidoreductase YuxK